MVTLSFLGGDYRTTLRSVETLCGDITNRTIKVETRFIRSYKEMESKDIVLRGHYCESQLKR